MELQPYMEQSWSCKIGIFENENNDTSCKMSDATKFGDLEPVKIDIAPKESAAVTGMNPNGMT